VVRAETAGCQHHLSCLTGQLRLQLHRLRSVRGPKCAWSTTNTASDNCYILNRDAQGPFNWRQTPVATLASPFSGIQVDVYTDQDAFQIYTCNNLNGLPYPTTPNSVSPLTTRTGTLALKETQGFFNDSSRPRVAKKYGCVVMEVEDWIDGINYPEWGRGGRQVFGPGDGPYVLEARYEFLLNQTLAAGVDETV